MQTHVPMKAAINQAVAAKSRGEVPVGAVVIDSSTRKVIARAYNLTETQQDPTAHAEILAIRKACRKLGSPRLERCDMYVTLEPCPMCAQAISFARIRRLYFGAYDPKGGGVENGARIFHQPSCHHRPEVIGGMEETACAMLLKTFFAGKRR
jgi:tRNA(Arg) A34 adenosine deaminase TadA